MPIRALWIVLTLSACLWAAVGDGEKDQKSPQPKKADPQPDPAARRAQRGAPHFAIHLTAVPLAAAVRFLSEKTGYPISLDGLDPRWPVTIKRKPAAFFSHLLALCKEARATFAIDTTGKIILSKGPMPSAPRLVDGPFLAEVLYVERVTRYGFRGQPVVLARAAVRLRWEPGVRLTGHSQLKLMMANRGPGSVTQVVSFEAQRKTRSITIPAIFQVELSPTLQSTTAAVGRNVSGLVGKGGDPKLALAMRSISTSATQLSIAFDLKGITDAARDRAIVFSLEDAKQQRVLPHTRLISGRPGQRLCKLGFKFPKGFAPARLRITYPTKVVTRKLKFEFKKVRLPR